MRRAFFTFSLLAVLLLAPSCAEPLPDVAVVPPPGDGDEYWPRWRGPSGQGVVDDGHRYTTAWSETANVLWKRPVPGFGFSSPIVWDDRIFLTTASPEPDGYWPAGGGDRRSVLCFRRSDGELLWETVVPDIAPTEKTNPHNGHASSTPTTDGERVYAYFGNDGLLALDFDGEILWHQKLGHIDAFQGTASSPLLYDDMVIVSQDHRGKSGSFIVAFDKRTGEPIWKTDRRAKFGWSSPVAIRAWGRDQIVLSGSHRVFAYDPATGEELWQVEGTTVETTPTPVVGESLLFCSSGRAGPTLAIRPDGTGDVSESHIAWQSPKGSPYVASPIYYDGILYMVNDTTGIATAYEAASGELLWQGRLGGRRRGMSFYASPIAVDGKIFFTDDGGDTYVLAAGREFEILRVNSLAETTRASPALVDGVWYIRTQNHLWAIDGDEAVPSAADDEEKPPAEGARAAEASGGGAAARRAGGPAASASPGQNPGQNPGRNAGQNADHTGGASTHRPPSDTAVRIPLTTEERAAGFVKLGNRRDMSPFLIVGASPESCTVEEDVIRCNGHPGGYFATRESYGNYTLRLDMRFPGEVGNSGILLHIKGDHKLWPASVEMQGHYAALGRLFFNTPAGKHGPRADNEEARQRAIGPSHEWNSIELQTRNGTIRCYINGQLIVGYGPLPFTEGPIGFQLEGADIEFRNIRLAVDDSAPAQEH